MAVTDLSGDLPWWLRQGTPTPQGTPPATQGAAPGQSGMGWLNYLGQMFAPNPANTPSANASPMSMVDLGNSAASNGFAVPPADPNQVSPPLNPNSLQGRANAIQPQNPNGQPTPVPAPAPSPTGSSVTMSPGPTGMRPPNTMDIAPGALSSGALGAYNNMPFPGQPDVGGVFAPRPGQGPPQSTSAPGAGIIPNAPAASPAAAPAPAGPLSASGGATGQGATSNPRFMGVPFSYDVPGTARSGRGAPIYTAMDLSGLFNRGQPVANAANVPAAAAQPVSAPAGPLASRNMSKAPWTMGPMQKGMGFPSRTPYGPNASDIAAYHSGFY